MSIYDYFQKAIWVQLLYSFSVVALVYTLGSFIPLTSVQLFTDNPGQTVDEIGENVEGNFDSQFNISIIDIGALVIQSGNLIVDLILNFITAIPNMVNILLSAFFLFFPIDAQLQTQVKTFVLVGLSVAYMLATLAFLTNVRSRGAV